MKQIKKKKRILLCIGISLIFLVCLIQNKGEIGKKEPLISFDKMEEENELDDMIQYLIEEDSFAYDETKITIWETGEKSILLQNSDAKSQWKIAFISASIDVFRGKYDEAEAKFSSCIESFPQISSIEVKARVYYELSKVYIYLERYEKSNEAAEQMIKLYEEESEKDYLIQLNIWRSYDVSEIPNGVDIAVDIMEETMEIAKDCNYSQMEVVYYKAGIAYSEAGRFLDSMEYKIKTLNTAEEAKNVEYQMLANIDIGIDYYSYRNYTEALRYLQQALEYKLEDSQLEAKQKAYAWINIIGIYIEQREFEQGANAIIQCEQEIQKEEDGARKRDDFIVLEILKAELKAGEGKLEEALKIIDDAKEEFNKINYFTYYNYDIEITQSYGNIHYLLGNYKEALQYHKEAERLLQERGVNDLCDINERLLKDYEALGDYENAVHYAKENYQIRTEALTKNEYRYSSYLLEKFQSEKKEMEIDKLSRSNQVMTTISYILGAVFITVIISILYIAKKNREIQRLNIMLKDLSVTDELTKIPNRRALDEYLSEHWEVERGKNAPIACFMIDIDFFKKYNDNYGHPAGDKVLEAVAKGLKDCCTDGEFIARYGGEEFVMILLNANYKTVVEKAEKIISHIRRLNMKHEYSPISERITLSIGIATTLQSQIVGYKELIKMADQALYEAKKERNRYYFFSI